jgi:hypothetical protein
MDRSPKLQLPNKAYSANPNTDQAHTHYEADDDNNNETRRTDICQIVD